MGVKPSLVFGHSAVDMDEITKGRAHDDHFLLESKLSKERVNYTALTTF